MKKNTWFLGFAVLMFAAVAVVAFQGGFIKTAHAAVATCSDGLTSCGVVAPWNPPGMVSTCSIYGNGNYGGQICDTNVPGLTYSSGNAQSGSWTTQNDVQGVVPGTYSESGYNEGFFGGQGQIEFYNVDDDGSVQILNQSGAITYQYSYFSCSCSLSTGNDVAGSGCGGQNQAGLPHFDTVTVNPGDKIDLKVVNACKSNGNYAVWGDGKADITGLTGTYCYSSSNSNSPYIDPNNPGLGRRDYRPTAAGVCTWDNQPAPPQNPQPALTLTSYAASVDDRSTQSSVTGIRNDMGDPGSSFQPSVNLGTDPSWAPNDLSGAVSFKNLPPWLMVANAASGDCSSVPKGGDCDVTFQYKDADASAGTNVANNIEFDCIPLQGATCKTGYTKQDYSATFTVPSPIAPTLSATAVRSGQASTLSWSTGAGNYVNAANPIVSITGSDGESWTSGLQANGSVTTGALNQAVTFTIKVKGRSNNDSSAANFNTSSVTVTPVANPPLACSILSANPQTQSSAGAQVSFNIQPSGGSGTYKWSGDGGATWSTTTGVFTVTYATAGSHTVAMLDPALGGSNLPNCANLIVNAPSVQGSADLSIYSPSTSESPVPYNGSIGSGSTWKLGMTSSNLSNTAFNLCAIHNGGGVSCTPMGSTDGGGNWSLTGIFAGDSSTLGSWTEWTCFGSVGACDAQGDVQGGVPISSLIVFQVSNALSCNLSANPSSGTGSVSPTLTWSSSGGATSCTASGGSSGWAGSRGTSGSWPSPAISATTNFNMTCTNGGGNISCNNGVPVTVTVGSSPTHYSCAGSSCVVNQYGPFTSSNCNNSCQAPPTYYSCSGSSCVINQYGYYTSSNCNNSCVSPVSCSASPGNQTPNQPVTFTAYGGNGTYSFSIPGGVFSTLNFSPAVDLFPSNGTYTATVFSGGQSGQCSVVIGNPVGGADLTITDFHLTDASGNSKSTFASGEQIYPSVTVKNIGATMPYAFYGYNFFISVYGDKPNQVPAQTPSDVNVWATLDGYTTWAAGESRTYSITSNAGLWTNEATVNNWTKPVGSYTARAFIDSWNVVPESNENNNQSSMNYTVTSGPLAVAFSSTPASGSAPLAVALKATTSGGSGGNSNYTFWQDCSYSSATPTVAGATTACGAPTKSDANISSGSDTDNVTYQYGATPFHPLVIVVNGASTVMATSSVTSSIPPGGCMPNATSTCTTAANACGMTASGTKTCNSSYAWGSCSVSTPPDSACGYTCNKATYSCSVSGTPTSTTQAQCAAACVPPPPISIVSFTSSASGPIIPPETATLTWSSSGATSCSIDHGVGNVGTSGTATVAPTASTTYTLTCTGIAGSASQSLTVTVGSTGLHETNPGAY